MNESNEIKRLTAEVENLHKLVNILIERADCGSERVDIVNKRIDLLKTLNSLK